MGFLVALLVLGEVALAVWVGCLWYRLDELVTERTLRRIDQSALSAQARIRERRRQAEVRAQDLFAHSTVHEEPEGWR